MMLVLRVSETKYLQIRKYVWNTNSQKPVLSGSTRALTLTLADNRVRFLGVLAAEAGGGGSSISLGERARFRVLRELLRFLKFG